MKKVICDAAKSVATDSPDHLVPNGTKNDNSRNPLFNRKLYHLFGGQPVSILDLGCAGGGFVQDCLADGHFAVGLEGSDYSQQRGRGAWAAVGEYLHTCDLTQPVRLSVSDDAGRSSALTFDVVTSWELMEHIPESRLDAVCDNVRQHLKPGGLWIMSVADFEDVVGDVVYHQTVRDRGWWLEFLRQQGFVHHEKFIEYFADDWVRGPLQQSESFHLVLTRAGDAVFSLPKVPAYGPTEALALAARITTPEGRAEAPNLSLAYGLSLLSRIGADCEGFHEALYLRAVVLLLTGDLEHARGAVEVLHDLHPDDPRLPSLGAQLAAVAEGRPFGDQNDFIIHLHRAERLLEKGEFTQALVHLHAAGACRAEAEDQQGWRALALRFASRALDSQQWALAADLLGDGRYGIDADGPWHFLHGQAMEWQGRLLEARQLYDIALRLGPEEFLVRLRRAAVLRKMGRPAEALPDLERALAIRPDDPAAQRELAEVVRAQASTQSPVTPVAASPRTASRPAQPKISIVTPTFNCARYLRECIESILAQGYDNLEHIVVDGASTDETKQVLAQYPHIRWISEPDEGEAEALNKALRMVTGDLIGWLNADDSYQPGAIEAVLEAYRNEPQRDVFYGKTLFIDDDGTPTNWVVPHVPLNLTTLTRGFALNLFQPSMFFGKHVYDAVGDFREDLNYGVDYEYWFRMAAKGFRFHYVDRVLANSRIYRSGGKTETSYADKAREWMDILHQFLPQLSFGERMYFWKDYYTFRLKHYGDAFYHGKDKIEVDPSEESISGFALAAKEGGVMDANVVLPVIQQAAGDCANMMGLLGEHLRNQKRWTEAEKAFEWALALENGGSRGKRRFGMEA